MKIKMLRCSDEVISNDSFENYGDKWQIVNFKEENNSFGHKFDVTDDIYHHQVLTAVYVLDDMEIIANNINTPKALHAYILEAIKNPGNKDKFLQLKNSYRFTYQTINEAVGVEQVVNLEFKQSLCEDKMYILLACTREQVGGGETEVTNVFDTDTMWYYLFFANKEKKHKIHSVNSRKTVKEKDAYCADVNVVTNYELTDGSVFYVEHGDNNYPKISCFMYDDECAESGFLSDKINGIKKLFDKSLKDYSYSYTWRISLDGEEPDIKNSQLEKYGISKLRFM